MERGCDIGWVMREGDPKGMSAKAVLRRWLPAPLVRIGSIGLDRTLPARRHNLKRLRDHARWKRRTARLTDKVLRRYGPVVQSGPFAGLRLSTATAWEGSLAPLLVGSYEAELHDMLEELIASK